MTGVAIILLMAVFIAGERCRRAERRAKEAETARAEIERYHVGRIADLHLRVVLAEGRGGLARELPRRAA